MMFAKTLLTSLALAFPALAIPPPNFGFPEAPNDTALTITFHDQFNQTVVVQEAALYGYDIAEYIPNLSLNASQYSSLNNYTGEYLVLIVDPDASTPNDPNLRFICHWLQPGFTQSAVAGLNSTASNSSHASNSTLSNSTSAAGSRSLVNTTGPVIPYLRPSPAQNSSAHRYIYYAFQQPSNFSIPSQWSGLSASNRTHFNLTHFISDTKLGTPAAANYFYLSNQTSVPANFTGAPGSTFPGGDGFAVTSGDPYATATANSASRSSSSMAKSSTGGSTTTSTSRGSGGSGGSSATASSTSSHAGAAMVTGMGSLFGAGVVGIAALL